MTSLSTPIPRLPEFDSTFALMREGYHFIGNRCVSIGSDIFCTRFLLHEAICIRGPAAAQQFYQPGRFTRRNAMPRSAVPLLQDWGSVQMLDDDAHRHRKQAFLTALDAEWLERAVTQFREQWNQAAAGWEGRRIVLADAVTSVLAHTALRWCGIPPDCAGADRRTQEFSAMIDAAGSFGPRYLRARLLRARCERWASGVIRQIREDKLQVSPGSPVAAIAFHDDLSGRLLPVEVAGVELINVLRPTVAIARYVVFAAHALHAHQSGLSHLHAGSPEDDVRDLVQEVRRFYPFFPAVGGRVRKGFAWNGHEFLPRDWVLLDLYGTNHHAGTWSDPEEFRPARFRDRPEDAWSLIPQGGGDYVDGHRCPGEVLTIALTMEAVRQLLAANYSVPTQNLEIPSNRFPTMPRSGFVVNWRKRR